MDNERLSKIFEQQFRFQELVGADITTQQFKSDMVLGLYEETTELLKETPHKKHKKNQEFNEDKFLKECADAQLYLVNLVISAGCSANEFMRRVKEKQKINVERQKNDY